MPPPPAVPTSFEEILKLIWWRLDSALDEEMIRASARLGALEALERGCTAIVDHHESPNAIEGSLSVIADACAEVGVRVSCAYGVTDRHGSDGARRGLAENERFLKELQRQEQAVAASSPAVGAADDGPAVGAAVSPTVSPTVDSPSADLATAVGPSTGCTTRAMVGVHAAFTCTPDTLAAAAQLADDYNVGVHIHVAEGPPDTSAVEVLAPLSKPDWLLIHGVLLPDGHDLVGTIVHNPRSNLNNGVGYARPSRFSNPIALGTDGIGADMLEEFRLAYVCARSADVTTSPETAWQWLANGEELFPEVRQDEVLWSYESMDPWHLAFTTGVSPLEVLVDGEVVFQDGIPTRVDPQEIRAHGEEQAKRLFARLG